MAKIAFIGLGAMGSQMARHLTEHGHELVLYNRTRAKSDAWVAENGGRAVDSPAEAATGVDAVITCVGNDDDLASVALGRDGAFKAMTKGAVFIDHTTVSARIARQLAVEAKDLGILAVDAPVTGGEVGAKAGTLTVMCGGSAKAVEAARPIMQSYAERVVHVGRAGAGQTTKMCNQIAFVGTVQSLAEALRFAQAAELDMERVFESISHGAAASWQMTNYWRTMAEERFDFGLAIDWMRKDLGLAMDEARNNGAALPVAALIDQFFADVQAMGGGRQDTSALVRRLPRT